MSQSSVPPLNESCLGIRNPFAYLVVLMVAHDTEVEERHLVLRQQCTCMALEGGAVHLRRRNPRGGLVLQVR